MSINIEINHQLLINIDDKVYISDQISTDMIEDLNKKCFGLIVNNRPDNEEINQPKSFDIKVLLEEKNIVYKHIPFSGANIQLDQILNVANLLKLEHKTLLFCRSGARSSLIWGLASIIYLNEDINDIMRKISNVGYDSTILPSMVEYFSNIK
tara:strand:- start:652 stop:1110 length:459 start_codon:yes stop_codon:yes gene_type:complete